MRNLPEGPDEWATAGSPQADTIASTHLRDDGLAVELPLVLRQRLDLRRPPRPAERSVAPHPLCGEGGSEVVSAHESASGRRCTPAHRPRCGRRHRAWRLASRPPAAHRLHLVFSAAKLRRRAGLRCLFRRHARAGLRGGPRLCDGLAAHRGQAGGFRRARRRTGGGRRRPVLVSYHRRGDGREACDEHDPDRVLRGERSGHERPGPVVGAPRGQPHRPVGRRRRAARQAARVAARVAAAGPRGRGAVDARHGGQRATS